MSTSETAQTPAREPVSPVLDALGVWMGNVPVPAAQRLPEPTSADSTGDYDGYAVGE